MKFSIATAILGIAFLGACTGIDPAEPTVCEAAAAHVASCLGNDAPEGGGLCDADGAQVAMQALNTSCDAMLADGKADAFSSGGGFLICVGLGAPVFAHGLEQGALCCFDHNCEGSLVCGKGWTCKKPQPAGGQCERVAHCQDGLGCKSGKCAPKVAAGGTCDTSLACEDDLICDARKKCNAPAVDGATCKKDDQCESWHCNLGKCVTPSVEGGPCGGTRGICDGDLVCKANVCAQPAASGNACTRTETFPCPMNETCWDGKCERAHKEGGACTDLFDCEFSLFCRGGKCGGI